MFPKEDISQAILDIPESWKGYVMNVGDFSWDEFTGLLWKHVTWNSYNGVVK